jgi:hypothetical protein
MRCEDFGTALLSCAKKDKDEMVDVRAAWAPLHELPDRTFAPPPVILPVVVTAENFEDAMIWHASTRARIGLPALDLMGEMSDPGKEREENGTLPVEFRAALQRIFGTPYDPMSFLDLMAIDKPPRGYDLG